MCSTASNQGKEWDGILEAPQGPLQSSIVSKPLDINFYIYYILGSCGTAIARHGHRDGIVQYMDIDEMETFADDELD